MAESDPRTRAAQQQTIDAKEKVRTILQSIARVILADRRAVALATAKGEVLLSNAAAKKIVLGQADILDRLDWPSICASSKRSGSTPIRWNVLSHDFEGEVIHVPLGAIDSYMIRLAQSDLDLSLLRHRARAAALMRVAHDLRTPIQSLLASANALIEKSDGLQSSAEAAQLRRAAELALDHISTVLQVIRGEKPLSESEMDEDFRITDELRSIVALIKPIAATRNTEIEFQIDAPSGLMLHGPLRYVRALFQNLIDNSVNHGGGRVSISLTCKLISDLVEEEQQGAENWCVEFRICDEGGGLPAPQKTRLARALGDLVTLTAAEDAPPPLAIESKRPSAGLNVMANALKQLGGVLEVHDRGPDGGIADGGPDQRLIGTIFVARFSLQNAPDFSAGPAVTQHGGLLAGKHILLVEDSPASRDWLCHVLQSEGAEVHAAGSGPEALALLSRNDQIKQIDLMLSDVTLPRMSGIELAARLTKGDPAAPKKWSAKIVGLTAHADDQIRAACLAAGMTCVLEKPIKPQLLTRILSEILGGSYQKPPVDEKDQAAESIFSHQILDDLIRQLGLERTKSFIHRAIGEARHILDELERDGVGPDTGRRLHAATGACGLTGLQSVEKRLRRIEVEVNTGKTPTPQLLGELRAALEESESAVNERAG